MSTQRLGGVPLARLAAALVLLLAGCAPAASFSPEGPCLADGRAPGAYPDLEADVPAQIHTVRPPEPSNPNPRLVPATSVDSGRNCSADALGSLAGQGVSELRFAGAVWDLGNGDATTLAVLALPEGELPAAWVEDFYEAGARTGKKTDNVETSRPTLEPVGEVFRVDTLNDLSLQSVVVWQRAARVGVVIVATRVNPGASREYHDARVRSAVDDYARPQSR